MEAVLVFLFFVPFQSCKRMKQRSREIISIALKKAKFARHVKPPLLKGDLERRIARNYQHRLKFTVVPEYTSSERCRYLYSDLTCDKRRDPGSTCLF